MADEEKDQPGGDAEAGKASKGKSILPWILLGAIVPICAGAGFGLGRLLAGNDGTAEKDKDETSELEKMLSAENPDGKTWFFQDLEPVVSNLTDPGAIRYVRAGFMFELSGSMDQVTGHTFLVNKVPLIKNWLAIYLASQSVEDLQGERNLTRVLAEIRDLLNARLFPDTKGPIKNVLLSEFAIQ